MGESGRKLTKAEEKRLAAFKIKLIQMVEKDYRKVDLTTSVVAANTLGVLYGILLCIPFAVVFVLLHDFPFEVQGVSDFLLFWGAFFILIVVHELIHGLTWSRFTEHGLKDIEFGVIWRMLTPYCTCKEPLKKIPYMLGAGMPCLVLGILPCIISWITGSGWLLGIGLLMILGAGGDLLILVMILRGKFNDTALFLDHPTEVGLVVFEK